MLNARLETLVSKAEEDLHHSLAVGLYDIYSKIYKLGKEQFNYKFECIRNDVEGAYRVGLIDDIKRAEVLVGLEDARNSILNSHRNQMVDQYGEREVNIRWWMDKGRSREEAERLENEAEEV